MEVTEIMLADNASWSVYVNDSYAHTMDNNTTQYTYPNFYNFNLSDRVKSLLSQPHYILALILGAIAISLNVLSILAIMRTRRHLTAHYCYIISLALSDILVGTSVTLHVINHIVNPAFHVGYGPWNRRVTARCAYMFIKALNTTSLNITLLNLMGMAIDHFLAILRPLHYPTLMGRRRAFGLLASFWILAIVCGFSDFLSGYPKYNRFKNKFNYCEFIYLTKYQDEYPLLAIAIICLFVMTSTYVSMFLAIKRRHQNINVGPVRQDVKQNKKALCTTLLILGTFILCWLPTCLFQICLIIAVKIDQHSVQHLIKAFIKADAYLYDLLLLNAVLDPIIYAVRMREVQYGYRKMCCMCRHKKKNVRAISESCYVDSTRTFHMSLRSTVFLEGTISN